jgi:hypothetical protein
MARREPLYSGDTFLIVTEGEKTEPHYLERLRRHLRLTGTNVHVVKAEGTDALSVVKDAIRLREKRVAQSRRGEEVPYDSVWAVFDTERAETNPTLNNALQTAEANQISVAASNPSFEFWLLLHDEYTTKPFYKSADVIKQIKTHVPGFDKSEIPVDRYIPDKIPTAVKNAARCEKHHADIKESSISQANPVTHVHHLVRELNWAAREENRFSFP